MKFLKGGSLKVSMLEIIIQPKGLTNAGASTLLTRIENNSITPISIKNSTNFRI